jgi:hypothetical protein
MLPEFAFGSSANFFFNVLIENSFPIPLRKEVMEVLFCGYGIGNRNCRI